MLYSLIIPHFNDPERLDRLLRSVPLDRADLEVLVVDDCSTDQFSLDTLKSRWTMVHWLSTAQNAGAGAARNVALGQAQGEFLVFADSDDEFLPGAFELFDNHVEDDDELVYFLAEAVQEVDSSPSNRAERLNGLCKAYLNDPSDSGWVQLSLGHVVPWAKVYSRRFVETCGVTFEETLVSNDVAFNVLAALQAVRMKVVPMHVYRIHRRPKSLTANPSTEAFLERVAVKARLASDLKQLGINGSLSATGWMLESFTYGPRTTFLTWRLCLNSDLRIDVLRVFQFARWIRFLRNRRIERAEKNSASSSRGRP